MGGMSRHSWKRSEREISKRLGGKRIPVTGIDRHGADVVTPLLHVQVKTGRNRPSYLADWLDGICADAQPHGKAGVVIWQATRERIAESVVVMRLSDFEALHGKVRGEGI